MTEQSLVTAEVSFPGLGCELTGYIASPAGGGQHPVVIVVHEMWGLTGHIRDVTRRVAREGYVAVAPDMFSRLGHPVTRDRDEGFRLMAALPEQDGVADLFATLRWVAARPEADASLVAMIGFCMGGTYSLLMACEPAGLRAAVPFYGQVAEDDKLAQIGCPVLYIGAELDYWAPKEQAERLEAALKRFSKPGEVVIYPDCPHAFFNDDRPEVYRADEAASAWQRLTGFLARYLGPTSP